MNLGLIGGGYWGKNLINEFNNCGVLNTICDINSEALKNYNEKYPNIKTTTKWESVLDDSNITAVCIALPAEMHYKFAKESLQAGKDVYVEKPITLDIEEAKELISIAKEKNKILMVGHLLHYHPCIEKIKEIVKDGKIGKIKNIVANRLSLGIFRKHENVLWSFAPHDISVILNLCDNELPESISCHGHDYITKGIHDITNSILKYNDKYININVNWLNPYKEQKITIIGEKGMIVFDDVVKEGKLTFYPKYLEFSSDLNVIPSPVKNNEEIIDVDLSKSPLLKECEHFVECCKNRSKPITDGEEGLRVLKVLNSLQKSLVEKREIGGLGVSPTEEKYNKKYFVHETAIVDDGSIIGEGTKIWHFSHICKGAKIGKNCNIGQNVFIAGGAKIGDNCKVQNNVSIYAGVEAEDYVFFGPSCVLTNDINPRGMHSKAGEYIKTKLETGVTLGANCTIVCGNTLGKHALIGSGAVICKDVEPYSIMVGNPGKKIGEIDEFGKRFLYKEKKNILITGITGSLGRTLCKNLINNNNYNIFGIYNSEQKFAHFKRNKQFKSIKCFKLNISDITFESKINYIIKDNQINYLIHSAAMKHVDICEENQIEAVNTNIIASEILIKCCKLNNVTNMIGLSTDKTIEPCNIYGYSKLMMQNIILKNGYSIYQGANFFWSDGSVLDIWMNQMNKKKPLTVTNLNHQRYFNTLNFVSDLLVKNLDTKNTIILPESVYLIKIEDLLYAFMEYFNYNNYNIIGSESVEKNIEQLDDTISNRISINKDEIKELIKEYFD